MQQMFPWRQWLYIGVIALLVLASPGCSRKPEATPAPKPTPPSESGPSFSAKSYVEFGKATGARHDLEGAIAAFDEALRVDPKYAPAYYNRGFAHELQNKSDEALSDFDQAIQIDPAYKEAYYQRGSIKGKKGDFDGAISDFNQAIKLDPKHAPTYYIRGNAYYFKGDLDNALKDLNQAISLAPNFSYSYFIRGLIRHAQGHQPEATSDFQKSAGLNFPYASFWVWITEMENGQHDLARKDLSDALAQTQSFKPDDWPAQIANFLLNKITQDQLMAKTKAGSAVETNNHLCEAWFYAGISKRVSGDAKGAKDYFIKAIATGSSSCEEFIEANRENTELQKP